MTSKSLTDTDRIAREFARNLEPRLDGATVVALSGELGSGKTTFAKSFAAAFGIAPETITSPTFVIEKRFAIQDSAAFKTLIHIDAYRLDTAADIEKLGWNATLSDPANLILIEWPEKIGDALPADAIKISFSHGEQGAGEETREIVFQ